MKPTEWSQVHPEIWEADVDGWMLTRMLIKIDGGNLGYYLYSATRTNGERRTAFSEESLLEKLHRWHQLNIFDFN
jgi:hypothetical protein